MTSIILTTLLIVLAIVVVLSMYILSLRRIVPTNEVHIVQRTKDTKAFGKDTGSGNVYYAIPSWVPKFGVVISKLPTTIIDIDLNKYDAYDKEKLPFVVDIKAFFRVEDFAKASSRVFTVTELKSQLTSIVQGAARSILARQSLQLIMEERNKYGEEFTNEVKSQLEEWGVVAVKNIELMDIRDKDGEEVIANIMAKKKSAIEMERRVTVVENLQKAQEAEIEAKQLIQLRQQDSDREVGLRQAEVQQEVGIATEKQRQKVQEQTKITAEKEMEVKRVQEVQKAEIEKQAAEVKASQDKEVTRVNSEADVIKAEAEKTVKITNAEANKEQVELQAKANKTQIELKAEADLKTATNEAKGIELKGKASAVSKELDKKAEVAGDIQLKEKVTGDKDYQEFMIRQAQVEANKEIGIEQAKALEHANLQIFATGGNVVEGITNAGKVLNPKTGLDTASMLESFAATPIGKEITETLLNKLGKEKEDK